MADSLQFSSNAPHDDDGGPLTISGGMDRKGFPSVGDLFSPDSDRDVVAFTIAGGEVLGLSFFLQPGTMGVEADH